MIATPKSSIEDVREEVLRRRRELELLAQRPSLSVSKANGTSLRPTFDRLELQPLPPVPDRVTVRQLSGYDDRCFVELAYRSILQRPMDPSGECYIERLRAGMSKIGVLLRIRYGREGRSRKVPVRGLLPHLGFFVLGRIPVLGHVFRAVGYPFLLLWSLVTLPRQQQEQQRWRATVMSLFTKIEDHLNRSRQGLENALANLADRQRVADLEDELRRNLAAVETALGNSTLRECKDVQQPLTELYKLRSDSRDVLGQLSDRVAQMEPLKSAIEELTRRCDDFDRSRTTLSQDVFERVAAIGQRLEQLGPLQQEIGQLSDRVAQMEPLKSAIEELGRRCDDFDCSRERLDKLGGRLEELTPVPGRLDEVSRRLLQLETLGGQDSSLPRPEGQLELPARDEDGFYAKLEERFRGPTDEIRRNQEHYIPLIDAAGAGTVESPILDLGCGRGEWLGLLRSQGKNARGIDVNEVFIDLCRRQNLPVTRDDALEHLASMASGSLGAITGFHIVEHLSGSSQIRLIQLAFRALRPGGVLILETPNPEHLSVAALRFYLDPTHVRPIPAPLLEFMARHAGFTDVRIERRAPSGDGEAAQGWSQFQDYALIAFRATSP
jgi:SAM-dependent methyltransferase